MNTQEPKQSIFKTSAVTTFPRWRPNLADVQHNVVTVFFVFVWCSFPGLEPCCLPVKPLSLACWVGPRHSLIDSWFGRPCSRLSPSNAVGCHWTAATHNTFGRLSSFNKLSVWGANTFHDQWNQERWGSLSASVAWPSSHVRIPSSSSSSSLFVCKRCVCVYMCRWCHKCLLSAHWLFSKSFLVFYCHQRVQLKYWSCFHQ